MYCVCVYVRSFPSCSCLCATIYSRNRHSDIYRSAGHRAGQPAQRPERQSFRNFMAISAEERQWIQMINAMAYYRDVLAGAQRYIYGTTDGETWDVTGQMPDGSTFAWSTITYYQAAKCFVSSDGGWSACGSSSALVIWYVSAQCQQSGLWTMTFYDNGSLLDSKQFTLLPQINPDKVEPQLNQGAYSDAYDSICYITLFGTRYNVPCWVPLSTPYTIKQKGCFLTDSAMILSYHGVSVDPPTLNTWLSNNDGYGKYGDVDPWAVVRFAGSRGVTLSYPAPAPDPQKVWSQLEPLETYVCTYGPTMLGVKIKLIDGKLKPTHWVTATGKNNDSTNYLINDPNGGNAITLTPTYNSNDVLPAYFRKFGGPDHTYTDRTGFHITFYSPGELLFTDPQGRRVGYDPRSGVSYNEIPLARYDSFYIEDAETGDPGPETKELEVAQPIAGDYQLQVIGTGTGTYTLKIRAYDPDLNPSGANLEDVAITPGEVHAYGFNYAKTAGSPIQVVPITVVDTVPPVTVASVTPTSNANGWNNTNVMVNFSSTDIETGGTGVKEIHVSLSGAQTGTTVIPGGSGSVAVFAEGTTTVTYYAIDNAGNVETAKTQTLKIDKTPPVIAGMPAQGCTLWPPNHELVEVASVSAVDSLSGLGAFNVNLISSEPIDADGPDILITGGASQPQEVQLRAERSGNGPGRVYTITATATDLAGNTATATATCTVPHDQGR